MTGTRTEYPGMSQPIQITCRTPGDVPPVAQIQELVLEHHGYLLRVAVATMHRSGLVAPEA
jgi:hypothetical protein